VHKSGSGTHIACLTPIYASALAHRRRTAAHIVVEGMCDLRGVPRERRRDEPGDVHHVFVRGNARAAIALDDEDHARAVRLLERAVGRFEFSCHAWCYLPNHSHLLITSRLGNLSRAMHWLGTCSAHAFNERHERSGHVYQGRFGSKLVENDEHFAELARYIPLNPVRAGLCRSPEEWPWSSYAVTAGLLSPPWFLASGEISAVLGTGDAYATWVAAGVDGAVLDERGFWRSAAAPSLTSLLGRGRDESIARAHSHGYTQAAIAAHLGVSQSQICRRLAAAREASA
jgi:putative transposase